MKKSLIALVFLFAALALHAQTSCPTMKPFGVWSVTNSCQSSATCAAGSPVSLFLTEQPAMLFPCQAGQPCPTNFYKLQACDTVTWHLGDGTPDETGTTPGMITHTYAASGVYSTTATIANTLGSIQVNGTVTIGNAGAATLTPAATQLTAGAGVSLTLDVRQPVATATTIPLQASAPAVLDIPASVTIAAGKHTAMFIARALQAGRSNVTAQVPGLPDPVTAITVVDAVTVVREPDTLSLRAGANGTVSLSIQPPRPAAQTVTIWSTRPDVVAAPAALTIPSGGNATLDVQARSAGAATVWIATADGFSFYVDTTVTDAAAASLSRIAPANGPVFGGTSVTLVGQGLDARCAVSFGSVSASAVSTVANGLSVVAPAHDAGTVDVSVVCGSSRATLPRAFTFFTPRRRAAG
jgi:PKD repeat protein